MKKSLKTCLLTCLLAVGMTAAATAQTRVATLDLRKVFDNYWKTKVADAALKERAADLDNEYKGLGEKFNKGKEDYQKLLTSANDQAVSAEEREKRKKAAEDKLVELREAEQNIGQFERQARSLLEDQKRRMRGDVLDEIRAVVNSVARSANYELVLDSAAESIASTPIVIFTTGSSDLTGKVLEQLNANAPAPKPGDKKPEEKKPEEKKDDTKK